MKNEGFGTHARKLRECALAGARLTNMRAAKIGNLIGTDDYRVRQRACWCTMLNGSNTLRFEYRQTKRRGSWALTGERDFIHIWFGGIKGQLQPLQELGAVARG